MAIGVGIPGRHFGAFLLARHCRARLRIRSANLLVRIHFIIVVIRWTGLAPWEFGFPFPGCLTSTFLVLAGKANDKKGKGKDKPKDKFY